MFLRLIPIFFLFVSLLQSPAQAQDASELIVRMSAMEQQIRQMTGQIEQLEYENRQLKEQLQRLGGAPGLSASAGQPLSSDSVNSDKAKLEADQSPEKIAPSSAPVTSGQETRRDLFNPDEHPNAPGVPQPLGATQPSKPLAEREHQPELKKESASERTSSAIVLPYQRSENNAPSKPVGGNAPSVAATGSDPHADYEEAYQQFSLGRYREAEMGFRKFLQSHPRDERVPDAMYWLGEIYLLTHKGREAGEQFLTLTKQYPASPKAPSALLKLGSSLVDIGAADRGCAIFAEAARKYSKASQSFKDEIAREQRRANCS